MSGRVGDGSFGQAAARAVRDALVPHASAHRAAPMAAYMRDQFPFLGIPTPERRAGLRPIPKGFERSRTGEQLLEAVRAGLARDPKTLPEIERERPLSNGASATVELLKVLLRMTSEQHGVAAEVIATVDDLERIAADHEPAVPALNGWRRGLFGRKALAL